MTPTHVIHMVHLHAVVATLGPEHDDPTHDERRRHGDRVEQVLVNQVREQHPQHHRRHERQQQVAGKTPCLGLAGQAEHHFENLAAKLPHHRQDRRQLDNDVESHGPFAAKTYQVGDDNLVPGTGNRQKLRQPFNHAQDDCLEGSPKIHHSPGWSAACCRPLVLDLLEIAARGPAVLQRLLGATPVETFTAAKGFILRGRNPSRAPLHSLYETSCRLLLRYHLAISRVGPWRKACLDAPQ